MKAWTQNLLNGSRWLLLLAGLSVWSLTGCQPQQAESPTAADHDHDDHAHDHDHDGHDHDDHGHDHDHAGHDHDDHGHDHDHGDHDHDHGDHTVDAGSIGIMADDLPTLDQGDTPKSFADAVAQLGEARDQIKGGFEKDDPESVHGQLHEIGTLLESIETFVLKAKWDKDVQKEAAAAVDSLFDSYGDVDAKLHGDSGKEYSDVSDAIDTAVKKLTEIATESE